MCVELENKSSAKMATKNWNWLYGNTTHIANKCMVHIETMENAKSVQSSLLVK